MRVVKAADGRRAMILSGDSVHLGRILIILMIMIMIMIMIIIIIIGRFADESIGGQRTPSVRVSPS